MTERRIDADARDRIEEIREGYEEVREDYQHWGWRTTTILAVLAAIQLGLGGFSVYLLGRQDKADDNARRLDRAICAETHYLERGLTITGLDPRQAIVHNELKILLRDLRPLAGSSCPPAEPFVSPEQP